MLQRLFYYVQAVTILMSFYQVGELNITSHHLFVRQQQPVVAVHYRLYEH